MFVCLRPAGFIFHRLCLIQTPNVSSARSLPAFRLFSILDLFYKTTQHAAWSHVVHHWICSGSVSEISMKQALKQPKLHDVWSLKTLHALDFVCEQKYFSQHRTAAQSVQQSVSIRKQSRKRRSCSTATDLFPLRSLKWSLSIILSNRKSLQRSFHRIFYRQQQEEMFH